MDARLTGNGRPRTGSHRYRPWRAARPSALHNEIVDDRAAVTCAAITGRKMSEWLPAVRAYRVARIPVEGLFRDLMVGGDVDPAVLERIVTGTLAYRAGRLRDELEELAWTVRQQIPWRWLRWPRW